MTNETMSLPQNSDIQTISTLTKWNWVSGVILVALGLLVSPRFSMSIAVGSSIAILNFYWLRKHVQGLLGMSPRAATTMSQLRAVMRLILWAVVIYLLLVYAKLNPMGLLLGLSVLVINIFALTGIMLFRKGGHT